jgi:hypothetical protein
MRCLTVALTVSVLAVVGAVAGDSPRKVRPIVVWSGTDSGRSKPAYDRCRSAAEWAATWEAHTKEGGDAGREAPGVDFESYMVLGLFQGDGVQNRGLDVVEVIDEPDCLRVRYVTAYYQIIGLPDSEADKRRLETRSYALAVLPRSDKAVVLEEGNVRTKSDWKERGRISAAKDK